MGFVVHRRRSYDDAQTSGSLVISNVQHRSADGRHTSLFFEVSGLMAHRLITTSDFICD
jgi:hypothetical protein